MKNLLKVNIVLTLVISFVLLVSFSSDQDIKYTHHFKEVRKVFGGVEYVVVKEKYRKFYDKAGGYVVLNCPSGTVFNCHLVRCDFTSCPCGGI